MNGCDPFMYSMPPSYGGVVGVGSSCDDDLDLTLRLGLPSYDEPEFKFNGNTNFDAATAARRWSCGTYHDQYLNISYHQCPCPQLATEGWNTTYGAGLNNPSPYGGGWPYGANQTALPHYAINSTGQTGAYYGSVGGYHSAYTYGSSSSVQPVSNVSNGTLSRGTTHDQDAVSTNVGGSRKKYEIRNQCVERMAAPEEVDRRCTKCNSDDTPMWRKGPLGPKTLCNACGIKYGKDMEKKKVEELAFAYMVEGTSEEQEDDCRIGETLRLN